MEDLQQKYIEHVKKQLDAYWSTEEINVDLANNIASHLGRLTELYHQQHQQIEQLNKIIKENRNMIIEK